MQERETDQILTACLGLETNHHPDACLARSVQTERPISGIDTGMLFEYTQSMKTAISVPDDIFEEVDRLAKDHNWSRSEVFVIAVKHYLDNLKSQKLLAALNMAYSEQESTEERTFRQKSKRHFAKRILKEA